MKFSGFFGDGGGGGEGGKGNIPIISNNRENINNDNELNKIGRERERDRKKFTRKVPEVCWQPLMLDKHNEKILHYFWC